MSKKTYQLIACLLFSTIISANNVVLTPLELAPLYPNSLEVRAGHLFPNSRTIDHVYRGLKPEFSLQLSHQIDPRWELWLNAGHLEKKGSSKGELQAATRLRLRTLTVGANLLFPTESNVTFYLGLGGGISNIRINNQDTYYRSVYHKTNPCGVVKSGMKWDMSQRVFADVFLDYGIQRFSFKTVDNEVKGNPVNMSGLKLGIGFGFKF